MVDGTRPRGVRLTVRRAGWRGGRVAHGASEQRSLDGLPDHETDHAPVDYTAIAHAQPASLRSALSSRST